LANGADLRGFPLISSAIIRPIRRIRGLFHLPYSVLHENAQLFASKYKLVLPTEEELRAELDRERALLAQMGRGSA